MDEVEVAGLRIAVRRAGHGPPLVLLHGGVSDGRVWREQLEALSDEYTVVAWDAPGCGGSSDPPVTFRLADYADCLAGLIEALGLRRPHVLGHSFGAGLALELAGRHPGVPRSLVLAGGYAGWAGSLPPDEVQRRLALAVAMGDVRPGTPAPGAVPGLVSDAMAEERRAELAQVMHDVRPGPAAVMAHAFAEADLRAVLPAVAVPTLVLHGEADERSPMTVARQLHAGIPGSTLVVLPGVGHESYLEDPLGFTAEVRRFLRSVA